MMCEAIREYAPVHLFWIIGKSWRCGWFCTQVEWLFRTNVNWAG